MLRQGGPDAKSSVWGTLTDAARAVAICGRLIAGLREYDQRGSSPLTLARTWRSARHDPLGDGMSTRAERKPGSGRMAGSTPATVHAANDRVIAEISLLLEWLVVAFLVVAVAVRPQAFAAVAPIWLAVSCRLFGTVALTLLAAQRSSIPSSAFLFSILLTGLVAIILARTGSPDEVRFWAAIVLQTVGAATFIAGLGLPTALALMLSGALGAANATFVGAVMGPAVSDALTVAHYLAYALVPAVAGSGARRVLAHDADHASVTLRGALAGHMAVVERRARLADHNEQARVLHDTALNTLGAVAHGHLEGVQNWVREQARHDASSMRMLAASTPTSADQLPALEQVRQVVSDFRDRGLQIDLAFGVVPELPPAVARALAAACREALTNVDKHAGPCRVRVRLGPHRTGVQMRVADNGHGFRREQSDRGIGLKGSIIGRMTSVGGAAHVESNAGLGTEVVMTWIPVEDSDSPAEIALPQNVLYRISGIALLMIVTYVINAVVSVVGAWNSKGITSTDLFADGVFLFVNGGVFVYVLRRQQLNGWLTGLLILHAPAIMLLTGLSLKGCQAIGSNMPFGGSMVGVAVIIALLRPTRDVVAFCLSCAISWLVLGFPAILAGESCAVIGVLNIFFAPSAAAATLWFANAIRRHARVAASAMTTRELTQAAAHTERLLAADRARLYSVLTATVMPTLAGIGCGDLDPSSLSVRSRCGAEAVLLRGYLTEVSDGHPLTAAVFRLALELYPAGVLLEIRSVGGNHELDPDVVSSFVEKLRHQLLSRPADDRGSMQSVTVLDHGDSVELSLVQTGPQLIAPAERGSRDVGPHIDVVIEYVDGDQVWTRLKHDRARRPAELPVNTFIGTSGASVPSHRRGTLGTGSQ